MSQFKANKFNINFEIHNWVLIESVFNFKVTQ